MEMYKRIASVATEADRAEMLDPADPVKNIGIRLVFKIARDVRYQNLLGLNVLTVRI